MTPDELRARADAEDAVCAAATKAGDTRAAMRALDRAELLRQVADEMESSPALAPVTQVRHRAPRGDGNDTPAMRAAKKAGYVSVRAVAAALGKDPTFMSKVFRGLKPMPDDLAADFERLTKFPAARWRR